MMERRCKTLSDAYSVTLGIAEQLCARNPSFLAFPDNPYIETFVSVPHTKAICELIRRHELDRFNCATAGERQELARVASSLRRLISSQKADVDRCEESRRQTKKYVPVPEPQSPRPAWNLPDRFSAAACLLGAAGMPVMAFLSQQAVLQEDGRAHGIQAAAFAAYLVAVPLLLKSLHDSLQSDRAKQQYMKWLLIAGISVFPFWTGTFVTGFGAGFSQGVPVIDDMSTITTDSAPGSDALGQALVLVFLGIAIVGEACASAGLFLAYRLIVNKHTDTGTITRSHDFGIVTEDHAEASDLLLTLELSLDRVESKLSTYESAAASLADAAVAKYEAIRALLKSPEHSSPSPGGEHRAPEKSSRRDRASSNGRH
ncbi:MAG: hypothetical protein KF869_07910 [Phycisphaeraceae bacterium]|nr:hypothetical protein [Phycisphaeraceae bacterium]